MNIISPDIVSIDVSVDTDKHIDDYIALGFIIRNNIEDLHIKHTYMIVHDHRSKCFPIGNCIVSTIKYGEEHIRTYFKWSSLKSECSMNKIQFSFITQLGQIDSNIITINHQV